MPLNEKNVNRYNIRRAETFAKAGINDLDLRWAHPHFDGRGLGNCSLCGKKNIHWLFRLHFDKPDLVQSIGAIEKQITRTDEVTFKPVGSECIQDWFEALPESMERLEFLKRWEIELRKMRQEKAAYYTLVALQKAGFKDIPEALTRADAIKAAMTSRIGAYRFVGLSGYEVKSIYNLSKKLKKLGRLSAKGVKFLIEILAKAELFLAQEQKTATTPAAPPPPPAPKHALLVRAETIMSDPVLFGSLSTSHQETVKDIVAKVTSRGSFVSGAQKNYLADLLDRAEAGAKIKVTVVKPDISKHPLIVRADTVLATPEMIGSLDANRAASLKDILARAKKYGSFYSAGQESYLEALVTSAENKGIKANKLPLGFAQDEADAALAAAAPGTTGFASASGLAGARY